MNQSEIVIGVLALTALLGIIILSILSIPTDVLVPVLTILVGYLVGRKQDQIVGAIVKKWYSISVGK